MHGGRSIVSGAREARQELEAARKTLFCGERRTRLADPPRETRRPCWIRLGWGLNQFRTSLGGHVRPHSKAAGGPRATRTHAGPAKEGAADERQTGNRPRATEGGDCDDSIEKPSTGDPEAAEKIPRVGGRVPRNVR